jgi:hypothetical protein
MRNRPFRRPTLAGLAVALAAGALLWAGLGGAATAQQGNPGRGRDTAPGQVATQDATAPPTVTAAAPTATGTPPTAAPTATATATPAPSATSVSTQPTPTPPTATPTATATSTPTATGTPPTATPAATATPAPAALGERPGWGCGDTNHEHTGPPGNPDAESPCATPETPEAPADGGAASGEE